MKLEYLIMNNFRSFYGETEKINFAHGEKNVTVVHAKNGSGKTGILNAFTWALYDSFTPAFKFPKQLVNKRAISQAKSGDIISAWVEIKFSHNDKSYIVKRTKNVTRVSDTESNENFTWTDSGSLVRLQWQSGDGHWHNEELVDDVIGRVLPKDLHGYFFFDGERIEKIVDQTSEQRKEIKNAAKKLLGLEIVERGITHLDKARKHFEAALSDSGDSELKKLIDDKSKIETEKEGLEAANKELNTENGRVLGLIETIEAKLSEHKETKAIQERRAKITIGKEEILVELFNIDVEIRKVISKYGYSVFIKDLMDKFKNRLEYMRKKGELPSGIKRQFVDDLLQKNECICGTNLSQGSKERDSVSGWRAKAGLVDVEEKAIRIGAEIKSIEDNGTFFSDNLKLHVESKRKKILSISEIELELDDISKKLIDIPKEEISTLETQRGHFLDRHESNLTAFNENNGVIKDKDIQIKGIYIKIDKLQSSKDKVNLAKNRVEASISAKKVLGDMLKLYEVSFKDDLQEKMQEIYLHITNTPYKPVITSDFGLKLQEETTGSMHDVAASTGESQVLSLTFISGIIEVARAHIESQRQQLPGPDASSYPVVMDSPFGALDPEYRTGIADYLPKITDQVVVLASMSQWGGGVEASMRSKIGKEYFLTYNSPTAVENLTSSVNGKSIILINKVDKYEWTTVGEVKNG